MADKPKKRSRLFITLPILLVLGVAALYIAIFQVGRSGSQSVSVRPTEGMVVEVLPALPLNGRGYSVRVQLENVTGGGGMLIAAISEADYQAKYASTFLPFLQAGVTPIDLKLTGSIEPGGTSWDSGWVPIDECDAFYIVLENTSEDADANGELTYKYRRR